ncbi:MULTISPECIES: cell division suppressor protein YneA [Bacillus]|uniref:Cell division suppressor protein YneA n=2 Tax=Bacillus TaxID=1386 RepID=A0A0M4G7T6_9BACI|nr:MULTISPECIES: cell division suppressor protein YneA [Bacillus]ALC81153.1 peptidoglycan-binding protein [Bacillus gobiensis]MBP1080122.1 cell division protein YceG involved in septum cleavage [Bacillus capparidis]MED1095508.1 cell division suppressor protein YneA [Bacillus capparidis]
MKKESFIFFCLFAFTLCVSISFISFLGKSSSDENYVKIEVQEGDSLWNLAELMEDKQSLSKQAFIEWVTERNHLTTDSIKPGDILVLPVEKEHPSTYQLATVE